MQNLQSSITAQDNLKSEIVLLRNEVKNRDAAIVELRQEGGMAEAKLRDSMYRELRDHVLTEAMKAQEQELKVIYQKKEDEMKNTFASKVYLVSESLKQC